MLKLTWLGHACFALEAENYRILLDPYAPDYVPGLGRVETSANLVLCSHDHADHGWKEGIPMPLNEVRCPFTVTAIPAFHDEDMGSKRGLNTIHVIEYEGIRVAHLGDLGHDLDEDDIETLGALDAVLIPIGGTYTLDCQQASDLADKLQVKTVIPMHYRRGDMGFEVLPSKANFIFAKSDEISGEELYRQLKDNGILVRWFDADRIRDYVRITVGNLDQMVALVDGIGQILMGM